TDVAFVPHTFPDLPAQHAPTGTVRAEKRGGPDASRAGFLRNWPHRRYGQPANHRPRYSNMSCTPTRWSSLMSAAGYALNQLLMYVKMSATLTAPSPLKSAAQRAGPWAPK